MHPRGQTLVPDAGHRAWTPSTQRGRAVADSSTLSTGFGGRGSVPARRRMRQYGGPVTTWVSRARASDGQPRHRDGGRAGASTEGEAGTTLQPKGERRGRCHEFSDTGVRPAHQPSSRTAPFKLSGALAEWLRRLTRILSTINFPLGAQVRVLWASRVLLRCRAQVRVCAPPGCRPRFLFTLPVCLPGGCGALPPASG